MEINHEIAKLHSILKIPITDVSFKSETVEIISGNINIGGIPFFSVAGILNYETPEAILNWLNWTAVYKQNQDEIDRKVVKLIGSADIDITVGSFRKLFVHNANRDLLGVITCVYDTDWKIFKD